MQPLLLFSIIFPDHRLIQIADELRYPLPSRDCAVAYEYVARKVILAKGLPLTAHVETWESSGVVREVAMVVRPVPEEYAVERMCADECPDCEDLSGGWWSAKEE